MDVPAQADGQDHPHQLNQSHSKADTQNDPEVGEQPALHAGSTTRVVYGPVGRLSLTEAAVGKVPGGGRDVLAGAGKQQLGAVGDHLVLAPVQTAAPATALHILLDEIPGLLRGRVFARVVLQHLDHDR